MTENDADVVGLAAEVKRRDLSFFLLLGIAVLVVAGFWIANHPQWAVFGLLSKLMSIAVGAWIGLIGVLLIIDPTAVRWIASRGSSTRTSGIICLCMSAGFLIFGFVTLLI